MKKSLSFFSIGIFVLIALAFLILIIIGLGAGRWFKPHIYADTFFHESVQGLSIGSPVKFRGVEIGEVSKITFLNSDDAVEENHLKDPFSRAVFVKMSLNPSELPPSSDTKILLKNAVHDGLRVRLTPIGFTGGSYLELDFFPAQIQPEIPAQWTNDDYYIPSIPSTFKQMTEEVEDLATTLKKINIQQLSNQTLSVMTNLNTMTWRLNRILDENQQSVQHILQNLDDATDNLKIMTQKHPSQLILSAAPPSMENTK
jgi:phospholipid/cholesterol/gamma-HCH transport system substrate-binding protein